MADHAIDSLPADEHEGDPLEAGLRAAFGPDSTEAVWAGRGVIATLERESGVSSRILLRDEPGEPAGVVDPRSPEVGAVAGGSRYQVAGEIARGGVGVVLKGRDVDLGRDVAMKVLRAEHADNPTMMSRLVEEAQIGGQLQHPGVLPVYEMGLDATRRPFFTMKLVRGQTLSALLQDRIDPSHERRRYLGIFEDVCQTMAYAHARGVVHRDLKPSNIMVGAFGEVQVVDWGLAKVLSRGGVADERRAEDEAVSTVRTGTPGSQSEAGSVLGTPAYMAPEQARGEVAEIDERCDVFALGAILCEILTGEPPYVGTRAEVLRQAAEGHLEPAFSRLGGSGVDTQLEQIARRCLSPERQARPREAGVVARELTAYLASVEERARAAELTAATAQTKAAAERKIWRRTLMLATLIVLSVMFGGGYYLRAEVQRRERLENAMNVFLALDGKSRWILVHSESAPAGEAGKWAELLKLTRELAERNAAAAPDEKTRRRTDALVKDLRKAEAAARERAARAKER
jgi:serine/threonine protein kinase